MLKQPCVVMNLKKNTSINKKTKRFFLRERKAKTLDHFLGKIIFQKKVSCQY